MSPVRSNIGAWLVFLAVGAAMWFARYGSYLRPEQVGMIKTYGPYVVILLHIIIILTAFQDTVFQGILCIIIPFYSFYYLFLVSDAFYLRALGAGLLIGIGVDSALFFQTVANQAIDKANAWIASGGGGVRALPK